MPHTPFDAVLLSQVRLGVVTVLVERGSASFPELKELLGVTQGNLGIHLGKLEDADYVAVAKSFVGRRPRTTVTLTDFGREAFERHVARLADVAGRASPAAKAKSGNSSSRSRRRTRTR